MSWYLWYEKELGIGSSYDEKIADEELARFNGQFEIYHRENNTIFDVITACNLAYDVNKRYNYDEQNKVEIKIYSSSNSKTPKYSLLLDKNLKRNQLFDENIKPVAIDEIIKEYSEIKENQEKIEYKNYFECTKIEYSKVTGKVTSMEFKIKENS